MANKFSILKRTSKIKEVATLAICNGLFNSMKLGDLASSVSDWITENGSVSPSLDVIESWLCDIDIYREMVIVGGRILALRAKGSVLIKMLVKQSGITAKPEQVNQDDYEDYLRCACDSSSSKVYCPWDAHCAYCVHK